MTGARRQRSGGRVNATRVRPGLRGRIPPPDCHGLKHYADEQAALDKIAATQRHDSTDRRARRAGLCPLCGSWHVRLA